MRASPEFGRIRTPRVPGVERQSWEVGPWDLPTSGRRLDEGLSRDEHGAACPRRAELHPSCPPPGCVIRTAPQTTPPGVRPKLIKSGRAGAAPTSRPPRDEGKGAARPLLDGKAYCSRWRSCCGGRAAPASAAAVEAWRPEGGCRERRAPGRFCGDSFGGAWNTALPGAAGARERSLWAAQCNADKDSFRTQHTVWNCTCRLSAPPSRASSFRTRTASAKARASRGLPHPAPWRAAGGVPGAARPRGLFRSLVVAACGSLGALAPCQRACQTL